MDDKNHAECNIPPMDSGFKHIVVGRDRAHVRTLLVEHPHRDVISASHFFDKVRMLAFLYDVHDTRDDYAPLIFAQRFLHREQQFPLRFAKNFASLYASCFHGVARPSDVLERLPPSEERLRQIFSLLHHIDEAMTERRLTTGVRALLRALDIMRTRKTLPPLFAVVERVSLFHLVDLTMLEIEVIKELSRLGVAFDVRFPLDFAERGINTAVNFTARQFEQGHDLDTLELAFEPIAGDGALAMLHQGLFAEESITLASENFSLRTAATLAEEAHGIAEKILSLRMANAHARIAVAVRAIDARAELFKHALMRYGIAVRDRKGISLLKSEAGVLLTSLFSARLWGLPKSDVIGLINHPLFRERITDGVTRSSMLALITALGVDDRIVPRGDVAERYREKAKLYADAPVIREEDKNGLKQFLLWLSTVEEALLLVPERGQLKDFLHAVIALIERTMITEEPSVDAIKKALSEIARSTALEHDDVVLSLSDAITWIKTELASLTIPRPDHREVHAVEFLPLPEMLGRQFDHVFIADMAFGRLPQATSPDLLLDDNERARLNRLMERPFVRIFYEDPFEPMPTPPRQALEPFWFASAIASAATSVHFSVAERDEKEQEQAPGEFFLWLRDHVMLDADTKVRELPFKNTQYQRLYQAYHDRTTAKPSPYLQALHDRKRGFTDGDVGAFSFLFDRDHVLTAFAGRLGAVPTRALSPTMIEAFADCRLRGWLMRMVGLSRPSKDVDDIDARAIGQIAHDALERYFDGAQRGNDDETMADRLRIIIDHAIKDYGATNYVSNPKVLVCHQEWLVDALAALIAHLEHERVRMNGVTVLRERDFGLTDKGRPPLALVAGSHRYVVGGRIDRVDQTPDGFLIIDYKLSSSESLKAKLSPRNLLKNNFQAPIYVRLVAHHVARDHQHDVAFAFASIRDGELLPPLTRSGNEAVFDRIFNDDNKESLAHGIDEIFSPIMRGEIAATPGEHCAYCDFAFLCRRNEWKHHGC